MANTRLPQLDVLRAIAIILVLGHHMGEIPQEWPWKILIPWKQIGWMGVDLFFVLSGFLVSGLVIKEYQKYKAFDPWRFLIRRGLKIYPGYYAFLILSLPTIIWIPGQVTWESFLNEAFFCQNHLPNIWGHTWSLAIEEHFYIFLSLGFFILSRRADPLRLLKPACIGCLLLALAVRVVLFMSVPFHLKPHTTGTLVRLDSLAFGVLISYYYHTDYEGLKQRVLKHAPLLLSLGVLLTLPCAIWGYSVFFVYVFGYTMLYVGCGLIMLVALFKLPPDNKGLLGMLAGIGFFSYSIYLWHKPITAIFYLPQFGFLPFGAKLIVFIFGSIAMGILMAKLIELPALKLRDRLFPSRSSAL